MRRIQVQEGLRLCFPQRSEDFDDGLEVGIAVQLMATRDSRFVQQVSTKNIDQLRELSAAMHYRMIVLSDNKSTAEVQFCHTSVRPKLLLVQGMQARPGRTPHQNRSRQ